MENKLKIEIYNDEKKLIFTSYDIKTILIHLLEHTYSIAVNKSKLTKCKYNYNYSDFQTVTFKCNNYTTIIYNIPTSWGSLKSDKILNLL